MKSNYRFGIKTDNLLCLAGAVHYLCNKDIYIPSGRIFDKSQQSAHHGKRCRVRVSVFHAAHGRRVVLFYLFGWNFHPSLRRCHKSAAIQAGCKGGGADKFVPSLDERNILDRGHGKHRRCGDCPHNGRPGCDILDVGEGSAGNVYQAL